MARTARRVELGLLLLLAFLALGLATQVEAFWHPEGHVRAARQADHKHRLPGVASMGDAEVAQAIRWRAAWDGALDLGGLGLVGVALLGLRRARRRLQGPTA